MTNTLTVLDNRNGKKIEVKIHHDDKEGDGYAVIPATAFKQLGLRTYDPGYMNTASAKSNITFIDGDKGILRYRGYSIEDLCENHSFLDVAHLLIKGSLPNKVESNVWKRDILDHTFVHEDILDMMRSFRYDAHPMGQLVSTVSALSTFYPDANPALGNQDMYKNREHCEKQILRILGKMPTLAACSFRNRIGRSYNYPDTSGELSYAGNFLVMLDKLTESNYKPHPIIEKTLEVLFILHADHELNCSTSAVRHLASSGVDPFTAVAGGIGALYGPLHGGANEAVVRMLQNIGSIDKIPEFLRKVKSREAKLMGFGHRVYKNYDPRAKIIKKYAHEVFKVLGSNPLMEVAVELEKQALQDEFFVKRRLFPNVDFYSGLIYKSMGFPVEMFPVLFAIPRTAGWLAHWLEGLSDKEQRIVRPRQVYVGHGLRRVQHQASGDQSSEDSSKKTIRAIRLHAKL